MKFTITSITLERPIFQVGINNHILYNKDLPKALVSLFVISLISSGEEGLFTVLASESLRISVNQHVLRKIGRIRKQFSAALFGALLLIFTIISKLFQLY